MSKSENFRSVLFDVWGDKKEDRAVEQTKTPEVRLGTWTAPLFVCLHATKSACSCNSSFDCPHAAPHKENAICRRRWRVLSNLHQWIWPTRSTAKGFYCANCIAIPESRIFIPARRARLSEKNTKVICPEVIASCIGRCNHARPHDRNRFCKDIFPDDSIRLQCRSVNAQKHGGERGILLNRTEPSCHFHGETIMPKFMWET